MELETRWRRFQSLFYWITYSYTMQTPNVVGTTVTVSILILLDYLFLSYVRLYASLPENQGFNPYFTGLPILILQSML